MSSIRLDIDRYRQALIDEGIVPNENPMSPVQPEAQTKLDTVMVEIRVCDARNLVKAMLGAESMHPFACDRVATACQQALKNRGQ